MRRESLNTFSVGVELNQAGKYEVRVRAGYGEPEWALAVYFQASNTGRLFSHLLSVLRYLQRHEERLWLWGSNPSDRSLLLEELLDQAGLREDRRRKSLRPAATLSVRSGESFRPLQLAELKRKLAGRLAPPAQPARHPLEAARAIA